MSAWMILPTVNSSWLVMQPNIYFISTALYNYPSLIMPGHCSIKDGVASISATVHIFGFNRPPPTISFMPPAISRPPHRWGSSARPCWYSCLKPAAATAGETETLSGSVGQKFGETDIYLATVSSYGATKGHHRLLLFYRQGLCFHRWKKSWIKISLLLESSGKWLVFPCHFMNRWWFGSLHSGWVEEQTSVDALGKYLTAQLINSALCNRKSERIKKNLERSTKSILGSFLRGLEHIFFCWTKTEEKETDKNIW